MMHWQHWLPTPPPPPHHPWTKQDVTLTLSQASRCAAEMFTMITQHFRCNNHFRGKESRRPLKTELYLNQPFTSIYSSALIDSISFVRPTRGHFSYFYILLKNTSQTNSLHLHLFTLMAKASFISKLGCSEKSTGMPLHAVFSDCCYSSPAPF